MEPALNREVLSSKWIPDVSAGALTGEVARRVLETRLEAVLHWLPLAAHRPDDDSEFVHQLRTSTRRATAALQLFSDLIPEDVRRDLRTRLRDIRRAADAARNWDITLERIAGGVVKDAAGDVSGDVVGEFAVSPGEEGASCRERPGLSWGLRLRLRLCEQLQPRRRAVQPLLLAVANEAAMSELNRSVRELLEANRAPYRGHAKRRFARHAGRFLKPVLKKFFKAAQGDLASDEALHRLRIRTKKLRYALEIVAPACKSALSSELLATICVWQELLGRINDRVTVIGLLTDWWATTNDAELRPFVAGMLLAEDRARQEFRSVFAALHAAQSLKSLRRKFPLD
jgi:CHAD domain-containing protein